MNHYPGDASLDTAASQQGSSVLDGRRETGMGRWNDDELNMIYDRTTGKCHLCHKQLAWSNYGRPGRRAAWHVDHSVALARGGADDLRNAYAACIRCNCSKQDGTNRSVRARSGLRRAPLSVGKRREARVLNGAGGAGV